MSRLLLECPPARHRSGPSYALVVALMTLGLAGCRSDRDAMQQYLAEDHPRLTEGAAEMVDTFQRLVTSGAPDAERLAALRAEVIAPYAEVVARLEAYTAPTPLVERHHAAYLDAARRQLQGFQLAAEALAEGRSLEGAAGILRVTRLDFERWLDQVKRDAADLGVLLTDS